MTATRAEVLVAFILEQKCWNLFCPIIQLNSIFEDMTLQQVLSLCTWGVHSTNCYNYYYLVFHFSLGIWVEPHDMPLSRVMFQSLIFFLINFNYYLHQCVFSMRCSYIWDKICSSFQLALYYYLDLDFKLIMKPDFLPLYFVDLVWGRKKKIEVFQSCCVKQYQCSFCSYYSVLLLESSCKKQEKEKKLNSHIESTCVYLTRAVTSYSDFF